MKQIRFLVLQQLFHQLGLSLLYYVLEENNHKLVFKIL
jgi:hypothetical protein